MSRTLAGDLKRVIDRAEATKVVQAFDRFAESDRGQWALAAVTALLLTAGVVLGSR